jgi:hypothetical protein
VPRTEPETLDVAPAARGRYATGSSVIRQPAPPARNSSSSG